MRIYVGNLSYRAEESEIRDLFAPYGKIDNVSMVMDRETGRSRGFAFVEMTNDAEGKKAMDELNGQDFQGRSLTVNEARPRESRPGGGGGGGGGRFRS